MFFQAGCDSEQFILTVMVKCNHVYNGRFCFGQRAGLIEYDRISCGYCFQKFPTLHSDVMRLGFADR